MRLLNQFPAAATLVAIGIVTASCGPSKPRLSDLPKQDDRWVSFVPVDQSTKVQSIGKTKNLVITSMSKVSELNDTRPIRVGDVIDGVKIGAIRCNFHWNDSSYGNRQFMWRGKWGCMAGRNKYEVENAVNNDGGKTYDYIHVAPVDLQ